MCSSGGGTSGLSIVIALLTGALAGPPVLEGQEAPVAEQVTIVVRGREITYRIQLDRIGVRTAEAMSAREFLEDFDADKELSDLEKRGMNVDSVASNVFTVELDSPGSREELNRWTSRKRQESLPIQVGLVVLEEGFDTPMILTNELVLRLLPGSRLSDLSVLDEFEILETIPSPLRDDEFVLRLAGDGDAIELSERLNLDERVDFALPNFIRAFELRGSRFQQEDPYLGHQWHHANSGAEPFTTYDADVDATLAWQLLDRVDQPAIIAVIDHGFELTHPDIDYWENRREISSDGDDDGSYGNDVHGVNLSQCGSGADCRAPLPPITPGEHGTAAAGAAAATGDNGIGVKGSCPGCRMMPIQVAFEGEATQASGIDERQIYAAFEYARVKGASVISNSWGARGTFPLIDIAITDAVDEGAIVLFALSNANRDNCSGSSRDLAAHPDVVAVASSDPEDVRIADSGFGDCMSLLAPGTGGGTTDLMSLEGYNKNVAISCRFGELNIGDGTDYLNYTKCFGGTSMATPITAGVAGMLATVDPNLEGRQMRFLLQDTADKVEPARADYAQATGFSTPRAGHSSTHGWGRVNAFEAVRVAAPTTRSFSYRRGDHQEMVLDDSTGSFVTSGKGGEDIFIRDHELDWGNTEQPSNKLLQGARPPTPHWRSPDIKVDAPGYVLTPLSGSEEFEAFRSESVRPERRNDVYVRVRNRGYKTARGTEVALYWTTAGSALPPLPDYLWTSTAFESTASSQWHPAICAMPTQTGAGSPNTCRVDVPYSGSSVALSSDDEAVVVRFSFTPPRLTEDEPTGYSFFAAASSANDPISEEAKSKVLLEATAPIENNLAYTSVQVRPAANELQLEERFLVRNPASSPAVVELVPHLPRDRDWTLSLDGGSLMWGGQLQPGEERRIAVYLHSAQPLGVGELTIEQKTWISNELHSSGITYRVVKP